MRSRALKLLVSAAILFHLAAVIVPPLAGPPPASRLANAVMQPLRPYVGLLYLGHGYRFFAPDPGPGHSIEYIVTRPDGSTVAGRLPDAGNDRPRLSYHRRFMVSEKIAAQVPPTDAPREVRDEARRNWMPLVKGVARRLLDDHDGEQVQLTLVQHFLPGPEEVLAGSVEPDNRTSLGSFARANAARKAVVAAGPPAAASSIGPRDDGQHAREVENVVLGEIAP